MKDANQSMSGIPSDPSGIDEPHDILAAEEFAMPAPGDRDGVFGATSPAEAASHPVAIAGMIVLLVLLIVALKRRG